MYRSNNIYKYALLGILLVIAISPQYAEAAPRFSASADGVVIDNETGLMWYRDAMPAASALPFEMAGQFIEKLNAERAYGYSDWRLPEAEEMLSIVDTSRQYPALVAGGMFTDVRPDYYWTATGGVNIIPYAWVVDMGAGVSRYEEISYCNMHNVWPVRTANAEAWDAPSARAARSLAAKVKKLPTYMDSLASSASGLARPMAPTGLSVVPVSTGEIAISWVPLPQKENVWYNVYESGNLVRSASTSPLSVGELEPKTTKCYSVTVRIGGGPESSHSKELCATTWLSNIKKGAVLAFGLNSFGQLGDDSRQDTHLPVLASGLDTVVKVAAGVEHSLAVKADGTVWAWGRNTRGQLGDGSTIGSGIPVQVTGLSAIVDVAAGWYHSLALASDGTVWAWGRNYYGQLGSGTSEDSSVPIKVKGLSGIKKIAAGWYHSMALNKKGQVMLWGWNRNGQLAEEDMQMSNKPRRMKPSIPAVDISAGMQHSVALLQDGTAIAWGRNDYFQLGAQVGGGSAYPVKVGGLKGATDIDCDMHYCLALIKDGSLMGWGRNDYGQVMDNPSGIIDEARPIGIPGKFSIISAGGHQSLAVRQDGELWAWGWDYANDTQKSAPAPASAIKGYEGIASGVHFNVMIKGK